MNYGFAFVLIAFGGSLFYKGYKGWTWQQFYATVLQGKPAPAATGSSSASGAAAASSTGTNTQASKNVLAG